MSPVNVLAVMDGARRTISAQSKLSDDVMAHIAHDVAQARDAVAELAEAAQALDGFAIFDDLEFDTEAFRAAKRRMRTALARCGGDA